MIRKIIKDRPQDRKWAYNFWANMKDRMGDKEIAYQYYRRAMQEDNDFILPVRALAWKLFEDKEYEEALTLFLRAIEIDPNERSMDTGAALCYRSIGKQEDADKHYSAHLDKFPDDLYGYGNYSDFLMRVKKDTTGSTMVWQRASENIPESGDLFLVQAAFHMMKGDSLEALRLGHAALDLEPDNVSALAEMSRVYYDNIKDYDQSIVYSKRLVKALDKGRFDAYMRMRAYNYLALAEYEVAAYDSSIVHARMATTYVPDSPFPWSTLAEAYLLKGDTESFYGNIEKAIELGFPMERYLTTRPYNLIKDQSRLKRMMANYKKEMAFKG